MKELITNGAKDKREILNVKDAEKRLDSIQDRNSKKEKLEERKNKSGLPLYVISDFDASSYGIVGNYIYNDNEIQFEKEKGSLARLLEIHEQKTLMKISSH